MMKFTKTENLLIGLIIIACIIIADTGNLIWRTNRDFWQTGGPSAAKGKIVTFPSLTRTPIPFHVLPPTWTPPPTPTPLPTRTKAPNTATSTALPTMPTLTKRPKNRYVGPAYRPNELPEGFLPEAAQIQGMVGYPQRFPLDCEVQCAVDFAAFFGLVIDEMDFLTLLPGSDDPEQGFVGDYRDPSGQIPPDSYGVHAYPVASLLRNYGVNAFDIKGMAYADLQREIASGRPVIAWVVGNTIGGAPVTYTASNGNTTTVARFEHTVIVIGYQPTYLTILDGGMIYQRSVSAFMNSWGTLGNMAIVYRSD
jgi:uncharacterized protein YvpB